MNHKLSYISRSREQFGAVHHLVPESTVAWHSRNREPRLHVPLSMPILDVIDSNHKTES